MTIFQKNIIALYGEKGRVWLETLPVLIKTIAERLKLRNLESVPNLTCNYVLSGFKGDRPIILKMGLDYAALKREVCALKSFEGQAVVTVLMEEEGLILLERAFLVFLSKVIFHIKNRRP